MTTVEAPTTETLAREALGRFIAEHSLPHKSIFYGDIVKTLLHVEVSTDADVDRWAEALSLRADWSVGITELGDGDWIVHRYRAVSPIHRWHGPIALSVHGSSEHRTAKKGSAA